MKYIYFQIDKYHMRERELRLSGRVIAIGSDLALPLWEYGLKQKQSTL
jgi:hypothetical protein